MTSSPLGRIRRGAAALALIIVIATLGYRLAGWSWLDSLYMVAISISTVGYGEVAPCTPAVRIWTILVLVFGIST